MSGSRSRSRPGRRHSVSTLPTLHCPNGKQELQKVSCLSELTSGGLALAETLAVLVSRHTDRVQA